MAADRVERRMVDKRIYLYDSSLRSGELPDGGEFSGADRLAIAEALDGLVIDYVEGGLPGSASSRVSRST